MNGRPVALITGSARRLGRDIALDLAGHGWDVCIHFRRSRQEAELTAREAMGLGARAEVLQGDLDDEETCNGLVPRAVTLMGRLSAIVNNASIFEYDDVSTVTHDSMTRHWLTNTFPAIALSRALGQHVTATQTDGCVVNVLDQKLWNLNPDYLSYTLSKSALEMATKLMARSLAPRVRVVGVAPGVTLPSGPMTTEDFESAAAMSPLGRASNPSDIAGAVRYLLSASAITGTTLIVDGGQHMAPQPRDVMFLAGQQNIKLE